MNTDRNKNTRIDTNTHTPLWMFDGNQGGVGATPGIGHWHLTRAWINAKLSTGTMTLNHYQTRSNLGHSFLVLILCTDIKHCASILCPVSIDITNSWGFFKLWFWVVGVKIIAEHIFCKWYLREIRIEYVTYIEHITLRELFIPSPLTTDSLKNSFSTCTSCQYPSKVWRPNF